MKKNTKKQSFMLKKYRYFEKKTYLCLKLCNKPKKIMYCKKIISVSLLSLVTCFGIAQNAEKENVVRIESGLVQGFDHEGTLGFLGIPYAKVERFMPPMPVDKWDTVMVCNHWGPMTMQPMGREMSKDEMSEDCCVINVWTTDRKAKKPVMLWLHGGGGKVGTLLCMPDAKDLFNKAIILSGTILNVNTKEMTESLGKAVLAELGISSDVIPERPQNARSPILTTESGMTTVVRRTQSTKA